MRYLALFLGLCLGYAVANVSMGIAPFHDFFSIAYWQGNALLAAWATEKLGAV